MDAEHHLGAFAPLGHAGLIGEADTHAKGAWRSPATGTPASPTDAGVPFPSSQDIADRVAARLLVPKGPVRTVSPILGLVGNAISATALNSKISLPLLGGPGILKTLDYQAQIVSTGAAAGILSIFDGDSNAPLLRNWIVNLSAAGTLSTYHATAGHDLPFLNGILLVWTPIVAAFGASLIALNLDFASIPIGEKLSQSQ